VSKKGKHKTVRTELKQSVVWLESLTEVRRVILCLTENCRHKYSPGTLRYRRDSPGGALLNGYHGNGITDIFIHIDPIERKMDVLKMIKERYSD
jgi:hypothetical protein